MNKLTNILSLCQQIKFELYLNESWLQRTCWITKLFLFCKKKKQYMLEQKYCTYDMLTVYSIKWYANYVLIEI